MCGIAGLFGLDAYPSPVETLQSMTQRLQHRGPDDHGLWWDREAAIALGQQRLAIIDLSPQGHQPMHSVCGRYVCVYNGEIYNHLELRQSLQTLHPTAWRGHSDTETLLAAFSYWGIAATLPRLVGMFAIAVWDKQQRTLHLIRDRLGEKPLYYGWIKGSWVFASELKAFKALPHAPTELNPQALSAYLRFGYVPSPLSIYNTIFKLAPAQHLILSSPTQPPSQRQPQTWWSLPDIALQGQQQHFTDINEAKQALKNQLHQTIQLQSQADVPVGAFLSGGIDSSTVAAYMQTQRQQPIDTFTIGFNALGYDEAQHAKRIAEHLGTRHHELRLEASQALDWIPRLADLYDEPFADPAQLPTALLSQYARQSVTVALSGDGGDELFGGYQSYLNGGSIWRLARHLPKFSRLAMSAAIQSLSIERWNQLSRSVKRGEQLYKVAQALPQANSVEQLFFNLSSYWPAPHQLLQQPSQELSWPALGPNAAFSALEPKHRMMLLDSLTGLPDNMLCKVDRAAMGASLETRVPLLDHRIIELAWRMPLAFKLRHGQGKWILRQALYDCVPRELIERPKQGFSVPLDQWLRHELRPWAEALFATSTLQQQPYLNTKAVQQQWQGFLRGQVSAQKIWVLLVLQAWLSKA